MKKILKLNRQIVIFYAALVLSLSLLLTIAFVLMKTKKNKNSCETFNLDERFDKCDCDASKNSNITENNSSNLDGKLNSDDRFSSNLAKNDENKIKNTSNVKKNSIKKCSNLTCDVSATGKNSNNSKIIWSHFVCMKNKNGADTTDGIMVYYVSSGSKFCDFKIEIVPNLASRNNCVSVLENVKGEKLNVKIIDPQNEKLIANKKAVSFIAKDGKKRFKFTIKRSELTKKNYNVRKAPYKIEIYDGSKFLGYFIKEIEFLIDVFSDERCKIKAANGLGKTTDTVFHCMDKKGNLFIELNPRCHDFVEGYNNENLPSAFKTKNPIRVDFVDKNNKIVLSKLAKIDDSHEPDSAYNSQSIVISSDEDKKKLNFRASYTLKFYDGDKFLGSKFLENLMPIEI